MKKRLLMLISALLVASQLIMLAGCAGGGNGTVTTDDGADSICGPNTTSPNGSDTSDTGDGTTSPDTSDTTAPGGPETPDDPTIPDDPMLPGEYEWGSVPMGAGGFVTGVFIHPTEPDLVYIRTDVGGCYRWDKKNESWIQLMDMFTRDQESFYGVDGLALDANNPDVIYLAAGGIGEGYYDVLKSTDRGESWELTGLATAIRKALKRDNAGFDGNGAYRGSGERIAVDPANGNIVYVGTVNGGVWRSNDAGETWEKVTLPNLPNDGLNCEVRNICFDPTSAKDGKSMTIYIGTVDKGICRSTDGGKTWTALSGAPATANRMAIGKGGVLYVAAMNGLFRFDGNAWKNISPLPSREYGGVSVNPLNKDQVICSIPHPTSDGQAIWYSTNGGDSWTEKHASSSITSTLPWNQSPNINSNGHCIEFDWNKQGRIWNTDWFCATATDDITASAPKWNYLYKGLEEICPRNLACPPSGPIKLFISVADNRGFMYADTTQYPHTQLGDWSSWYNDRQPGIMSIGATAFCQSDPNFVGIAGVNWNYYGKVELSRDGGKTWTTVKNLPAYVDKDGNTLLDSQDCRQQIQYGSIVISSEKQSNGYPVIIIVPTYEQAGQYDHLGRQRFIPSDYASKPILVSKDWGETWQKVVIAEGEHIMQNHWHGNFPITADKVKGNKFYIIGARQQVYYSEDWGMTWTAGGKITDGWNYPLNEIKAAPYIEGEVWATMGSGLYRSSDGGKTFKRISGIGETVGFGFGKNAPDRDNPTVYVYGIVNGVDGIYRSIDMGKTWQRINTDETMIGKSPNAVEGDMQEFGTVYVTSSGRGVFYGRDTGVAAEEKTEYESNFTPGASLSDWSFYLNGTKGSNDYKTTDAAYLANSKMTANGSFMWQEIPNFSQNQVCIYDGIVFGNNYYFEAFAKNDSNGDAHKNTLYFNFVDMNHCYRLVIPNNGTMQLYRHNGGEGELLGSCDATGLSMRDGATIRITYRDGDILVEAVNDAATTELIKVKDSDPISSGGKIGVGSENAVAGYCNIHAANIK